MFWGPEVGACTYKLVLLSFGLTLRDSEWAERSLGLRDVPSCCEAKIDCGSAPSAPSALPFDRTLRDPEGAKDSLGWSQKIRRDLVDWFTRVELDTFFGRLLHCTIVHPSCYA